MELTKEQLLQIDNYIFVCGIKYYDVRTEIVDHFANILEKKLDENPDLDFKKEIINIHRNFSDRGFSKLLKEKTNTVQKRFFKQSFKHLIGFFKLPKIIISAGLFYLLFLLMSYFDNKEYFFNILTGVGFVAILGMFFNLFIEKKKKTVLFLTLNMNNNFLQIANNFAICFNTITIFRTDESFTNPLYNSLQLGVFLLVALFYWSSQTVHYQNKKEVQKQYPNVLV